MSQCDTAGCDRPVVHKLAATVGWHHVCVRCYTCLTTPYTNPRKAAHMTDAEFDVYLREARERGRLDAVRRR